MITGEILDGDLDQFHKIVVEHQPKGINISGPGGAFFVAVEIGQYVHDNGLYTYASGNCDSACAYIWMAGSILYYEKGAILLNHLPSLNGIVGVISFEYMAFYMGKIDESIITVQNIDRQANFFANESFDFIKFCSKIDDDGRRKIIRGITRVTQLPVVSDKLTTPKP